jgi:hypothetical protein
MDDMWRVAVFWQAPDQPDNEAVLQLIQDADSTHDWFVARLVDGPGVEISTYLHADSPVGALTEFVPQVQQWMAGWHGGRVVYSIASTEEFFQREVMKPTPDEVGWRNGSQ